MATAGLRTIGSQFHAVAAMGTEAASTARPAMLRVSIRGVLVC